MPIRALLLSILVGPLAIGAAQGQTFQRAWNNRGCEPEVQHLPVDKSKFDGHYLTTACVAHRAGLDKGAAKTLTLFSQAPDDVFLRYGAGPVAIWGVAWFPYRHRIVNTLHSLHGGDATAVAVRRSRLASLLRDLEWSSYEDSVKGGLLIHALADSYAHVYIEDGQEHAYNRVYGHALVHPNPDLIENSLERYRDYLFTLYTAIKRPPQDTVELSFKRWACYLRGGPDPIGRADLPKEERKEVLDYSFSAFNARLVEIAKVLDATPTEQEARDALARYAGGSAAKICMGLLQPLSFQ